MSLKPAERYVTTRELAEEVERWLADEPVQAWPEPWTIKTRRWTNRHRVLVSSAAACLMVASVALVAGILIVAQHNTALEEANQTINREKETAEDRRQKAEDALRERDLQQQRAEALERDLAIAFKRAEKEDDLSARARSDDPISVALVAPALIREMQKADSDLDSQTRKLLSARFQRTFYYGPPVCADCHNREKEVPAGESLLSRGTEMRIWNQFDKHKDATKNLLKKGGRGEQMIAMLMQGGNWDQGVRDARCINCHGVYVDDKTPIHKESFGRPEDRDLSGISCAVCHGPSSTWVNAHSQALVTDDWRSYSAKKKASFGMIDLRDPIVRSQLCLSCHLGSPLEGKVITHAMYAAGHPPLKGFELWTFYEAMPRHWRLPAEIRELGKKAPQLQQDVAFKDATEHQIVRDVVIGGVLLLKEATAILSRQASSGLKQNAWPDLTQLNCSDCHHDLREPSWRTKRGWAATPGNARLPLWPRALSQLGPRKLRGDVEVPALAQIDAALAKSVFGHPAQIAIDARDVVKHLDGVVAQLSKARFSEADSREVIRQLCGMDVTDFDSARQIGWALKAVIGEIQPEALRRKEFAELDKLLVLDFLKSQKEIVGNYVDNLHSRANNFDPQLFRKTLDGLKDLAGVPPKKQ